MEEKQCSTCLYYRQHYAMDKRRIFRVHCGHCTYPKAKRKKPDAKCCEHYEQAEADEAAFVTKEYLSKELLAYVLGLELLPTIEEDGNRMG